VPEYGVQKFLYGIGAIIALLIIVGLTLPRYGRVEVSTSVDAKPATVVASSTIFGASISGRRRMRQTPMRASSFRGPIVVLARL